MAKVNWKRLGVTLAGALLLLAGALYGFAAYQTYDRSQGDLNRAASRLEEVRGKAMDRGISLQISDIMNEQRLQGIEDFQEYDYFNQVLDDNPKLVEALIHPDRGHLLGNELKASPEAFDVLYRSASMEGIGFPVAWERGLLAPTMEQTCVIRMVSFATSASMVALEEGDQEEAWRRLRAGVRVMSQLKDEPLSDSVFAWSTAANRLLKTMYAIIERDPTDAVAVQATLDLIDEIGDPQSIEGVLPGDILKYVVSARDFDNYDEFEVLTLIATADESIPIPTGNNRPAAFETAILEFWMGALDEIAGIDNDIKQGIMLDRLGMEWALEESPAQFLGVAFPATYEQLGKQIAHVKQMSRMLHTVCVVVAEWQATGELPEAVVDDGYWTTDPVMEVPFYYRKTDDGFRLQALGMKAPGSLSPPRGDLIWVMGQGYGLDFTLASSEEPSS